MFNLDGFSTAPQTTASAQPEQWETAVQEQPWEAGVGSTNFLEFVFCQIQFI